MSTQLLEHLRDRLIEYGVAENTPEFCRSWLGRSEGYIRTLRHRNIGPSVEALAICANKLGYYVNRLGSSDSDEHRVWRERLQELQTLCELEIDRQMQAKWRRPERMAA